jgi:hypothetical protein
MLRRVGGDGVGWEVGRIRFCEDDRIGSCEVGRIGFGEVGRAPDGGPGEVIGQQAVIL